MIRVLFISNSLGFGGAAKILSFVANNLDKNKFKVGIYNFNTSPTKQVINENIEVFTDEISDKRVIRRVIQLNNIIRRIKLYKPDVIISFLNIPNFLSVLAGKLTNIPVIISERGDPYQCNSFLDKIIHSIYGFANGAVFQTDGAKLFFDKRLRKKSCVIANPVFIKDETIVANLHSPKNEISFVARFENKQKRQDIMLKAFKIVSDKYPEMILKFYGNGADKSNIKKTVYNMGLNKKVLFMGLSNNPTKDIKDSKMFVLTSDYEGIPNALIEAMAIGLPVVSTDYSPGGAKMLIEDGINGLIVPVRDPEAIALAIIKYIENPELAKSCGNEAKKIRGRYMPERIIKKWEAYIRKVLS
jgi:glycosyltransferase involved in cell wall biosynthesis